MSAFHLSKWYLDCVTDSGEASILYVGSVSWGMARLRHSSLLECKPGYPTARSSIRRPTIPEVKGSSILWRAPEMDPVWNADSTPIRNTIFTCDRGSVEWHCLMPRARVQFGQRSGFGYVEHLTMSIPPWELPIKNLRWGRFTSASDWIVWIDWQGEFSRRIVYLNGQLVAASVLEDGRVSFDEGTLTMDQALVIRDAPLRSGALSEIPLMRKIFPSRLLEISERKWRSRALLERPGKTSVEGWAIHESVSWPG